MTPAAQILCRHFAELQKGTLAASPESPDLHHHPLPAPSSLPIASVEVLSVDVCTILSHAVVKLAVKRPEERCSLSLSLQSELTLAPPPSAKQMICATCFAKK